MHNPIKQTERIDLIDALRGFALLGILMVNIHLMYEPLSQLLLGSKQFTSVIDFMADFLIKFLVEGKFYVIFSFLFGFGFYVFINKTKVNEDSSLFLFKKRLFILLIFGLAHIVLLWAGDVLFFYSVFGFVLILFRNFSDKKLIQWALSLALLPTVFTALMVFAISIFSQNELVEKGLNAQLQENVIATTALVEKAKTAYSSGSFYDIVNVRIEEYVELLGGCFFFFCPVILALFLFGYLAARKGIITNYKLHKSLFIQTFWWGFAIGIVSNFFYAISYKYVTMNKPSEWSLVLWSMHTVGGFSLGMCYISSIVLLFINAKNKFLSAYIAPIGRMALTNYLAQSFICALLFHSYGFALYGKIAVWQGIAMAIIIYSLQIIASRFWLKYFLFGPIEWLWRSLTYSKLQPMKKVTRNF